LDVDLEACRTNLLDRIEAFHSLLARNSFRLNSPRDEAWYKVPDSWEYEDPQRWHEAVDSINDAADSLITAYDALVRECRRKLLS